MRKSICRAALLALVSCSGAHKKVAEGELSGEITLSGAFAHFIHTTFH